MSSLTYNQKRIASITMKCSGGLSFLGSAAILYGLLSRKEKTKKQLTLSQILMGMSLLDMGSSATFIWGSWAFPSYYNDIEPTVLQPMGNETTCKVQAYFIGIFFSGIPFYNLSLAIFYYLAVHHNWTEQEFAKYRKYFHILPLLYGPTCATWFLLRDEFTPLIIYCWVSNEVFKFLAFVVIWIVLGIIVVLFAIMYRHVRSQEQSIRLNQLRQSSVPTIEMSTNSEISPTQPGSGSLLLMMGSSEQQTSSTESLKAMTRQEGTVQDQQQDDFMSRHQPKTPRLTASVATSRFVFVQGFQFAAVFFFTFFFPTLVRAKQLITGDDDVEFPFLFFMALLLPLQGFWNALVFFKVQIRRSLGEAYEALPRIVAPAIPAIPAESSLMARRSNNISVATTSVAGAARSISRASDKEGSTQMKSGGQPQQKWTRGTRVSSSAISEEDGPPTSISTYLDVQVVDNDCNCLKNGTFLGQEQQQAGIELESVTSDVDATTLVPLPSNGTSLKERKQQDTEIDEEAGNTDEDCVGGASVHPSKSAMLEHEAPQESGKEEEGDMMDRNCGDIGCAPGQSHGREDVAMQEKQDTTTATSAQV